MGVLSRYPLPADSPFVNQFFNLLFGGKQKPGPLFEFVTRRCWQTDQSVMAHRFHLVETFDIEARLSRITAPVLVLTGERDLALMPTLVKSFAQAQPTFAIAMLTRGAGGEIRVGDAVSVSA